MTLSPHYRNDSPDDLDDNTRDYLNEHYLKNLRNLDKENPKLLIVFSGGNAVGKSTLSRKLEKEFSGIVLENDGVKRNLLKYDPSFRDEYARINPVSWAYTQYLYKHLDDFTKNGLIIRDAVIDWYYDRILPLFKNYELFIIAFDLSEEKARELIIKRGDTPTTRAERMLQLLEDHDIHQARFRSEYTPDTILTDDTVFDHDSVIELVRKKIAQLS